MWLVWETISQDGRRWSKRGTDAANEFKSIQGIKRDSDRLSDSDEEAYVPEKLGLWSLWRGRRSLTMVSLLFRTLLWIVSFRPRCPIHPLHQTWILTTLPKAFKIVWQILLRQNVSDYLWMSNLWSRRPTGMLISWKSLQLSLGSWQSRLK